MINADISLPNLCRLLDAKLGRDQWLHFEAETILHGIGFSESDHPILGEKVIVLQHLARDFGEALSNAGFILWACDVANNEPAEFEFVNIPNSLELAWLVDQLIQLVVILGKDLVTGADLKASGALKAISEYVLVQDGFSAPCGPFIGLVDPSVFTPGQTDQDMALKEKAIAAYLQYMTGKSH